MKYNIRLAVLLMALSVFLCSGCSQSNTQIHEYSYAADVAFGEIFNEFNEVSNTSAELTYIPVDSAWWERFDSVFSNVNALYYANINAVDSDALSEADKTLNNALINILELYKDAYDVMNASRDSADNEITQYAYNNFRDKILQANQQWEQAVSAAASIVQ